MKLKQQITRMLLALPLIGITILIFVNQAQEVGGEPACLESSTDASIRYWAIDYVGSDPDSIHDVVPLSDDSLLVLGAARVDGLGWDALLMRLNPDGTIIWQKTYGGDEHDYFADIEATKDGGYVAAGVNRSFAGCSKCLWVVKVKDDGSIEWQKTYEGVDRVSDIEVTKDGGYIIASRTEIYGAGEQEAWVVKLKGDGSIDWQKTYGTSGHDDMVSVKQTSDGGYILAGYTQTGDGIFIVSAWVLKLKSDGAINWQQVYSVPGTRTRAASIVETKDGGFVFGGQVEQLQPQESEAWIVKLTAEGSILWQKSFQEVGPDSSGGWIRNLEITDDGGIIVAIEGDQESGEPGMYNWILLKLDVSGGVSWQKEYGAAYENGLFVDRVRWGGYVLGGPGHAIPGPKEDNEAFLLKVDQNGEIGDCDKISPANLASTTTTAIVQDTAIIPANTTVVPAVSSTDVADYDFVATSVCSETRVLDESVHIPTVLR